jgi:hypothetical protein
MKVAYREGNPIVRIEVAGEIEKKEYNAYLDTGAKRTLIPEDDAIALNLHYAGDIMVITGTGKDSMKLFSAEIKFFDEKFSILVLGKNLPEQAGIKAIVGRDILDNYKICFNGVSGEFEIKSL